MKNLMTLLALSILTISSACLANVTLICNGNDGEFSIRIHGGNASIQTNEGLQLLHCLNCNTTEDMVKFSPNYGSHGLVPQDSVLAVAYSTPRVESSERNAPIPRTPVEVTVDDRHLFDCYSEQ